MTFATREILSKFYYFFQCLFQILSVMDLLTCHHMGSHSRNYISFSLVEKIRILCSHTHTLSLHSTHNEHRHYYRPFPWWHLGNYKYSFNKIKESL